jgi:hypothetical protein
MRDIPFRKMATPKIDGSSEHGSREQLSILTFSTQKSEKVGCVNGHRLRSTPLTEYLGPEAIVNPRRCLA